jgi:vacuolar-type H+-ATPase subunit I/STV1
VVLPLTIKKNQRLVAAAACRDESAVIGRILKSIGFRELSLPEDRSGTATEVLPQLEGRLKAQTERLALLHHEIEGAAGRWRSALTALRRKVQAELDRVERIGRHRRTGSFYSVEGYLAKRPSEQSAFDLIQEMHDSLQHPHSIFMVPEGVRGAS